MQSFVRLSSFWFGAKDANEADGRGAREPLLEQQPTSEAAASAAAAGGLDADLDVDVEWQERGSGGPFVFSWRRLLLHMG